MFTPPVSCPAAANRLPPWAHPHGPGTPGGHGGAFAEEPVRRLPPIGTGGTLSGFETGWQGVILPIEVTPTLDVHVLPTPLAMFKLDQTDIDMARITAAGPAAGLYVGVQTATLAVKAAGTYAISTRIERSSPQLADCLTRLGFAGHRLVSDLGVNLSGVVSHSYDPVEFESTTWPVFDLCRIRLLARPSGDRARTPDCVDPSSWRAVLAAGASRRATASVIQAPVKGFSA